MGKPWLSPFSVFINSNKNILSALIDVKKEGRHLDDQSSNFKNLIP